MIGEDMKQASLSSCPTTPSNKILITSSTAMIHEISTGGIPGHSTRLNRGEVIFWHSDFDMLLCELFAVMTQQAVSALHPCREVQWYVITTLNHIWTPGVCCVSQINDIWQCKYFWKGIRVKHSGSEELCLEEWKMWFYHTIKSPVCASLETKEYV